MSSNNILPSSSLTQATRIGVIMSIISLLLMTSLFLCETYEFARPRMKSSIELDNRDASWDEALLRLNFNVSLFDVHCEFVSVGEFSSPRPLAVAACLEGSFLTALMSTANLRNWTKYELYTKRIGYADVWDSLGTNLQNITKDVTKYHIDRNGEQASFHGRNREQARVDHEVHEETLKGKYLRLCMSASSSALTRIIENLQTSLMQTEASCTP